MGKRSVHSGVMGYFRFCRRVMHIRFVSGKVYQGIIAFI